ncbi:hypothetical protein BGI41_05345 [Methanobrevibacter sp. 87.7]|uniref:DUF2070 family protein n=1 Tax=Methanobrevibacter sp. 87.7 TaxID=387957 RepID=UPI000B510A84|nr:DUF2070 family protein [Methanobrevibacter sp. 87.7]OWT32880.1 hypothetical protein BGI41_05345 [Methanobrevibacter sp. 87.7]
MSSMSSVASLSKYITTLPNIKSSIIGISLISFLTGIIISLLNPPNGNLIIGILGGGLFYFITFGISSIISGYVNQKLNHLMHGINLKNKHSMFLCLLNCIGICFLTILSVIVKNNPHTYVSAIEFSCILMFAFSFLVFWTSTFINLTKSTIIALIQPLIILILLSISNTGLNLLSINLVIMMFAKVFIGSIIFLIAIYLFIKTSAAPLKKNLNINMLELISLFVKHMNEGSHDLENALSDAGEDIDTNVSIVSFRNKEGKIKSLFISLSVHPGPFGNIGGGNMPTNIANRFDAFTMVAHGPSTHDFNPTNIGELDKIEEAIRNGLEKIEYSPKASKFVRYNHKSANIGVQFFNDGIVLLSTFAPEGSDDIEFSVGLTMMIKASKNFNTESTIVVDCHNSFTEESGGVLPGNPRVFELLDTIDKIEKKEQYDDIKVGCSQSLIETLDKNNGVGESGVKTMIIDVAGQKTAYILFDSNNMEIGFRQEILDEIKKLGIDEGEVMTTDTHSVNTIARGYNPIGLSERETIIEYVKKTIKEALDDLEEVEVGCTVEDIKNLRTFGPNNATELISTLSSTIQISKFTAPVTFLLSLFFTIWLVF